MGQPDTPSRSRAESGMRPNAPDGIDSQLGSATERLPSADATASTTKGRALAPGPMGLP